MRACVRQFSRVISSHGLSVAFNQLDIYSGSHQSETVEIDCLCWVVRQEGGDPRGLGKVDIGRKLKVYISSKKKPSPPPSFPFPVYIKKYLCE